MKGLFTDDVRTMAVSVGGHASGDVTVDYVPEAGGDAAAQGFLDVWKSVMKDETERRNAAVSEKMAASRPVLTDIKRASDCVPGMTDRLILHSGPPCGYGDLGGGIRRAAAGAAIYEGWAADEKEAAAMLERGDIKLDSADCHNASAAGCGVISPRMPVFCVEDRESGINIYAPASVYGEDRVSLGSCSAVAVKNLEYAEDVLVPVLRKAVLSHGYIDIFAAAREGMRSGDDCCLRTAYSSSLFRDMLLADIASQGDAISRELLSYLSGEELFRELFTAAVKAMLACARFEEGCSFITSFCCSGRTAGIRIAGMSDSWLTLDLGEDTGCGDEAVCVLAGAGPAALCCAPAVLSETDMGLFDSLRIMYDFYQASDRFVAGLSIPYSGCDGTPLFNNFIKMCRTSCPMYMLYRRDGRPVVRDLGLSLQTAALRKFVSER